jgi:phosphatidate cytidylyltransferase
MKRVLTALVLIPMVLLVVFRASDQIFTGVVGVFAIAATWEYLSLVAVKDSPFRSVTLGSVILFFAGLGFVGDSGSNLQLAAIVALILPLSAPFVFLILALRSADFTVGLRGAALSAFAFPYISAPMVSLVLLQKDQRDGTGWFFFLLLFLMVWSGDIFAFYVGKAFGKHKLAPRISPGKSWEGALASLISCVLIAWLFVQYSPQIQDALMAWGVTPKNDLYPIKGALEPAPFWVVLVIAVLTNVAAQVGDLVESMIKRAAGVKDSGAIIPGHGGVLDRIDALLFAAPVAAILFITFRSYFFAHP